MLHRSHWKKTFFTDRWTQTRHKNTWPSPTNIRSPGSGRTCIQFGHGLLCGPCECNIQESFWHSSVKFVNGRIKPYQIYNLLKRKVERNSWCRIFGVGRSGSHFRIAIFNTISNWMVVYNRVTGIGNVSKLVTLKVVTLLKLVTFLKLVSLLL